MKKQPKAIARPLQDIIASIEAKRAGLTTEERAEAVVAAVQVAVAPAGKLPPEQGWMAFAPVPSDLCRVSPFFPMSKAEISTRTAVEDLVISKSAWGEVRYTGMKLSTFEEDVFLAVLALVEDPAERQDSKGPMVWSGHVGKILGLMGLTDGTANYARVRRAIKLMRATTFELEIRGDDIEGCGLLASYSVSKKTKAVTIALDPVFYGLYAKGSVTKLDVERRAKLPGAVAKCVYRFVMSHRSDKWAGHWATMARSINLPMDKPDKELRRMIRNALAALVKAGVLKVGKLDGDIVTMERVHRSFAHQPEKLPASKP